MLKQQNHQAISHLYDNYAAALYGSILRDVKSKILAEQILEHTFITIWDNAVNYNLPQTGLLLWMLGISKGETIKMRGNKRVNCKGGI